MSKNYYVTVIRETATTYSIYADNVQDAMEHIMSPFSSGRVLETTLGNERIVSVEEVGYNEDV